MTATYVSGLANGGGGGIYGDANGNPIFGNLVGVAGSPSYYLDPSQFPVVYFMALLGAFTDSAGAIVGQPFFIGDGPFTITVPSGASELSMGFNDGGGGFFDNSGGVTMSISESPSSVVPEPPSLSIFSIGLTSFIGLAMIRRRATSPKSH